MRLGRFVDILGCFEEGLRVWVKHSTKRFWEGVPKFILNY